MRTFRRNFPDVSPDEVLDMVTRHPAAALGLPRRLGELRAGARADFLTLPYTGRAEDAAEALVANEIPPLSVYLNGQSA